MIQMRVDIKEKVWFVTPKEKRAIQRVRAMLTDICCTTGCSDCPLKIESGCIKNQFLHRFVRRVVLEEKK